MSGIGGWIAVGYARSKALESVPFVGDWKEGEQLPPGTVLQNGRQ